MCPSLLKIQKVVRLCLYGFLFWGVLVSVSEYIYIHAWMAGQLIVKLSAKHVCISRLRSTINANWGNHVNTITFASKGRLSVALNWKINRFHMISSNQRDTVWSSVVSKNCYVFIQKMRKQLHFLFFTMWLLLCNCKSDHYIA